MFLLRFDLRSPSADAERRAAMHRTAVEMARWADQHGCLSIVLSEHHAASDGYLPAPLVLGAAMAAVTEHVPIRVAATLLPLQDPTRLAEELVTLDHLSRGRVSVVLAVGYRPEEYELYGVDFTRRGAVADDHLTTLLAHLRGSTPMRPAPYTPGGPSLAWGGGSPAAARRAGRFGIGFLASTSDEALREAYVEAARSVGNKPGPCLLPDPEVPMAVFVNDDVDAGWDEVGSALLTDATAYAAWNDPSVTSATASLSGAQSVDELRAENGSHRVVTVEGAVDLIKTHGFLGLHPLAGGLDPATAWTYLHRIVDEVLPRLAGGDTTPATSSRT